MQEGIPREGRSHARWSTATSLTVVATFFLYSLIGDRVYSVMVALEVRPLVGLALAFLILFGARAAPSVWLASFLVSIALCGDGSRSCFDGEGLRFATASAFLITAVAWMGEWAFRRFVRRWNPFSTAVGVLRFALVALCLSLVGGTARTLLQPLFGAPIPSPFGRELLDHVLGDLASYLVAVPLVLILARARPPRLGGFRVVEFGVLLGLIVSVAWFSFGPAGPLPASQNLLVLLLIPLSLWAALRHGQWGAVISVVIIISFATWGTRRGFGAFSEEDAFPDADLVMKVFVLVISLSAHVLASVLAELEHSREVLEHRVAERTSERDRLLVEERAARAAAEESILVRDTFLSVASHELKTPLTSLQLHLQSILRASRLGTGPVSGMLERKIEMASRQVKRVALLVDELLDVSRITANRLVIQPEEVDLVQIVRELTRRFADDFAGAGSPFFVDLGEPILGDWDALRLEQVLSNLMANALKYGAGKQIEIAVSATDDEAIFSIRDHGIGIASGDQERIFERFQRAVVPGSHYGGLGLGLWIVRQIVHAMGGTVGVQSQLGEGSTFVVRLPRSVARDRKATA
ncbi:MAG TPA: ATP-binding protein [Vulgatibacter sp.]|nr:ATP-binding protein [Vulgatibacter sp.]